MKKIVQIIPYSYHIHPGGLEKIAQTISTGINNEKGFSCLNVASNIGTQSNNISDDTLLIPSFDLIYNFPIPKFWTRSFWAMIKKIIAYKPDVIQTHTRFFIQSFMGGIIAKRLGCKRIHVEHGSGFVAGYAWHIQLAAWVFDQTIGRWIFRQCDKIVTISNAHKKFIKRFTKKDPIVIYNPIDYIPKPKIQNTISHIGFVGRLVSLKGVDVLIQALKEIESLPRECTIVGDGNQRKNLETLTEKLGLKDRIIFAGSDDRSNWLHRFDIFVNPSYQEGLPTAVIEALLAGCIVVATDVGGTSEIDNDIILIRPGSIHALSRALSEALDKKQSPAYQSIKKFTPATAIGHYTMLYN